MDNEDNDGLFQTFSNQVTKNWVLRFQSMLDGIVGLDSWWCDSDDSAILWQSKNSKILQEHTRTVKNPRHPLSFSSNPLVQGSDTESTKNYKYSTAHFEALVGHNP